MAGSRRQEEREGQEGPERREEREGRDRRERPGGRERPGVRESRPKPFGPNVGGTAYSGEL